MMKKILFILLMSLINTEVLATNNGDTQSASVPQYVGTWESTNISSVIRALIWKVNDEEFKAHKGTSIEGREDFLGYVEMEEGQCRYYVSGQPANNVKFTDEHPELKAMALEGTLYHFSVIYDRHYYAMKRTGSCYEFAFGYIGFKKGLANEIVFKRRASSNTFYHIKMKRILAQGRFIDVAKEGYEGRKGMDQPKSKPDKQELKVIIGNFN